MLTQERLKEVLRYDPDTGDFQWLVDKGPVKAGDLTGYIDPKGYTRIRVDGTLYRAHRLAWLYMYGVFPRDQIDHKDHVKHNNALSNLREANSKQNSENRRLQVNNTSGFRGVGWYPKLQKWVAQIRHCKKLNHLGYFNTPEEASAAYEDARNRLFTHHK